MPCIPCVLGPEVTQRPRRARPAAALGRYGTKAVTASVGGVMRAAGLPREDRHPGIEEHPLDATVFAA